MSVSYESLTQSELPLASSEVAWAATLPAESVDTSIAAALAIAAPAPARKHSGFGVASLVISLFAGGGEFLLVALAAIMGAANPNMDATSPWAVGLGLLMCAGIPVSLVGLALGLVGMFEKGRHKVFPIVGIVFNTVVILGLGLLFVIGSQMPSGPGRGSYV